MTHHEELTKIAARLTEIAKEMANAPKPPSKICAIGEKKIIWGKLHTKVRAYGIASEPCNGCEFYSLGCPGEEGSEVAIEDNGSECAGTIWKAD